MRVIAGSHKGRRLLGPRGPGLRPTPDRVKEALFSILGDRVRDAHVLDLYAGTGAIGIEALSRGARRVTFVEAHPASLRVLRDNLTRCGLDSAAEVHPDEAEAFLQRRRPDSAPYDVIFADPPYRMDAAPLLAWLDAVAGPHTLAIIEHGTKTPPPAEAGRWARLRQYRYGDTSLSLYAPADEKARPS